MPSAIGNCLAVVVLLLSLGCWPSDRAQAQTDVDHVELKAFVTAVQTVEALKNEWAPRLLAAADDTERARLRQAARAAVVTALSRIEGITMERYDQIRKAAAQDPQLMAQVTQLYGRNGAK